MDEEVLGALAEARALGFLGPGPLEAHRASAAAFALALGDVAGPALDLGSGGGVPGLLLAAWFPDVEWLLLDRNRRRSSFLARAVADFGWVGRVEVLRAAAEEAARRPGLRGTFRTVTARSFGPPSMTAECAAGFLAPGGRLAVSEPPERVEGRWSEVGLLRLGLRAVVVTGQVALFEALGEVPADVPRSWRAMERRPVWGSRSGG